MRGLRNILLGVLALGLIGGVIFLYNWDVPPPTQHVEKVIDDKRFPN